MSSPPLLCMMYDAGRDGDDNGNGGDGNVVDWQLLAIDNHEGTEITHVSANKEQSCAIDDEETAHPLSAAIWGL